MSSEEPQKQLDLEKRPREAAGLRSRLVGKAPLWGHDFRAWFFLERAQGRAVYVSKPAIFRLQDDMHIITVQSSIVMRYDSNQ